MNEKTTGSKEQSAILGEKEKKSLEYLKEKKLSKSQNI